MELLNVFVSFEYLNGLVVFIYRTLFVFFLSFLSFSNCVFIVSRQTCLGIVNTCSSTFPSLICLGYTHSVCIIMCVWLKAKDMFS